MSAADDFRSDDRGMLAGEYVLGTLDRDEREACRRRLLDDPALREAVAGWERRLAGLSLAGAAIAPPPDLWPRIEAKIASVTPVSARTAESGTVVAFRRSRDRWRGLAVAASAIAAALVGWIALREPGTVPPTRGATYVAAVNRGGDKPALIVTVDLETRHVSVRPLAAVAPAGHSLELWYIAGKAPPRSMGLVGGASATLPTGSPADAAATFAVSLEPPGGSTTGAPTGAVLYSGQLVRE